MALGLETVEERERGKEEEGEGQERRAVYQTIENPGIVKCHLHDPLSEGSEGNAVYCVLEELSGRLPPLIFGCLCRQIIICL